MKYDESINFRFETRFPLNSMLSNQNLLFYDRVHKVVFLFSLKIACVRSDTSRDVSSNQHVDSPSVRKLSDIFFLSR